MKVNLRSCPICGTSQEHARLFIAQNITADKMTDFSFASRKEPEYMSHEMVHCSQCDLVYANRPPSQNELERAYHQANYDSTEEALDAARSYIKAIQPTLQLLANKQSVLEIGTGNGIFLEFLQREGFQELVGIEPSTSAIATAPEKRKKWIREGIFEETDFAAESFDMICCFMTMEHVFDPKLLAQGAFKLLRPGGVFVMITHDYRAVINRILGPKSPIIDIEHLQLFSKKSANALLQHLMYQDIQVQAFSNTYSIRYWFRLFPVPLYLKTKLLNFLKVSRLGSKKMSFNVGNLISVGFKPKN